MRALHKDILRYLVYVELFYRPQDPILIMNVARWLPLELLGTKISAGLEFEWFLKEQDSLKPRSNPRFGPRLTFAHQEKVSLTGAYQLKESDNIVRLYCVLNI